MLAKPSMTAQTIVVQFGYRVGSGCMGCVIPDGLRTVDLERLVRRLGRLSLPTLGRALALLQEMFAQ